ncbi:DUF7226 domain-containing protein [Schinkia azotoformans]|uniref:DUF7226 domain-containing protein n=1 Tax=Schinkia azotoformans TaxID=1454 RepID=UPI002DB7966E|nr:AAA-associated domain-containing protein [Schinkia azotoformans]MEC1716987.1 AAA-associated domain-containing protein [Schinkia azotoformans]MEC1743270.1 AAA-associated domain-containing protein [Schinkia azotoformans]MEC1744847.1 AAA-associated domain-containing protein [Schinkia azotoformans]MEC1757027.1 AAA-associated domain-containing protein [Schinkia azotoformans]MEC1767018.1 AAA-associated domain-containing protein [Schinkia azotoformans]
MLDSWEVPQADILADVIKTVRYVQNNPGCSDVNIANHIGKVDRQGRYYRHAAELLNLINNNSNSATITPDGQHLLNLSVSDQHDFLRNRIISLRVFHLTEELIRTNPGCTALDIERLLLREQISDSLAERRSQTILMWLLDLNVIRQIGDRLYIY